MRRFQLFNDKRENYTTKENWCIHCLGANYKRSPKTGRLLVKRNNDHVPSKCLLKKPYPRDLPTVKICSVCNLSFAPHEEYLAAFLGAVSHNEHLSEKSLSIFDSNNKLSDSLIQSLEIERNEVGVQVHLNQQRVDVVLAKNAKGHFYFENQRVITSEPDLIRMRPMSEFSASQRAYFEKVDCTGMWSEVGTRAFSREATNPDFKNGWVMVQSGQYRYVIIRKNNEVLIRSVITEEFAVEVFWKNAFN